MRADRILVLSAALLCGSCGGGGSVADAAADRAAQIAELVTKADAAETLSRAAARDTPCSSAAQCSVLTYAQTLRGCDGFKSVLVYSLAADTANAAKRSADEQNSLASQAVALQPVSGASCPPAVAAPAAQCTANRCVAAP